MPGNEFPPVAARTDPAPLFMTVVIPGAKWAAWRLTSRLFFALRLLQPHQPARELLRVERP